MSARLSPGLKMLLAATFVTSVLALNFGLSISLIGVAAFILYGMYLVRFEIVHPAVWLPPFIYIYHFNVVILYLMQYEHLEHPLMIVWIGWISIATAVLLFVTRCYTSRPHGHTPAAPETGLSSLVIKGGYGLTLLLLLQVCAKYFGSGYTDKAQFYIAQSMPELNYVPLWFMLFYALWIVKYTGTARAMPWPLVVATGGITLFTTLLLGERDIFLSYCGVSLFLLYHFYRPGKLILISLGLVIVGPLISVLNNVRNLFSRDLSGISAFSDQGMLLSFLYGEFIAGGRNLDILLSNRQWWDFFYGQTPLWVLEHKLFPGILVETRNSLIWFHQTFLPDWLTVVGGYGFTFSGDGYINFGLFGVALWYAIMACIIIWLFNRRTRSGIFLVVYVVSAPLFIFATRATMLYLPGVTVLILQPLLIAFLADTVLRLLGRSSPALTSVSKSSQLNMSGTTS